MLKCIYKYLFCLLIFTNSYMNLALKAMDHQKDEDKPSLPIAHKLPIGVVLPFAGENAPTGWLMCYGQLVSRFQYQELYNVIGKTYPFPTMANQVPLSDDLFCIPDMRGRVPVGVDNDARQGFIASNRVTSHNRLGESWGEEKHLLTINEIPNHNHNVPSAINSGSTMGATRNNGGSQIGDIFANSVGGDQPHNNMPPYLILNYIIKY